MKLTKEQIESLREAAKPLFAWLKKECHPNCYIVMDSQRCEVVEGLAAVIVNKPN